MPRDRRGDFSSHILFTREELFPPSSPEDLSFSLRSWDRVPELCLHSHVHGDEVTTSGFGEAAFVVCGGRGASPPGHGREWTPSPGQSCASKRGWGGQGQLWEQAGGSATRRRLEQSTEQAYGFVTPHPSIKVKSKYLEPSLRLGNLTHGSQMTETFRGTSDGFWVSSEGPKKRGWGGRGRFRHHVTHRSVSRGCSKPPPVSRSYPQHQRVPRPRNTAEESYACSAISSPSGRLTFSTDGF